MIFVRRKWNSLPVVLNIDSFDAVDGVELEFYFDVIGISVDGVPDQLRNCA